jgi:DNA-binding response OmpR family regulator
MEDKTKKLEEHDSVVKSASTIMVVDDEPNMCNALQRILENDGYRVIIALDGETALRLIPIEKPDVILLDIMMPGMHGREVCTRARAVSDSSIIYFTARADLAKRGKGLTMAGEADGFLTKPATAKRILSAIDFAISRR